MNSFSEKILSYSTLRLILSLLGPPNFARPCDINCSLITSSRLDHIVDFPDCLTDSSTIIINTSIAFFVEIIWNLLIIKKFCVSKRTVSGIDNLLLYEFKQPISSLEIEKPVSEPNGLSLFLINSKDFVLMHELI
jgi:hypothetical protein